MNSIDALHDSIDAMQEKPIISSGCTTVWADGARCEERAAMDAT